MFKKYNLFNANLDGLDDKPRWYTFVTKYNYECQVAEQLNKMANGDFNGIIIEAFPGVQEINEYHYNKKKEIKMKKKFNKQYMNYCFCKCKMSPEIWNAIIGITGIGSIMCTSGVPTSTDDKSIEKIKKSLELKIEFKDGITEKDINQ